MIWNLISSFSFRVGYVLFAVFVCFFFLFFFSLYFFLIFWLSKGDLNSWELRVMFRCLKFAGRNQSSNLAMAKSSFKLEHPLGAFLPFFFFSHILLEFFVRLNRLRPYRSGDSLSLSLYLLKFFGVKVFVMILIQDKWVFLQFLR